MSYMKSTDSAVLQEFGRIMQEKDELKKVAQMAAPAAADQVWAAAMQHGPNTSAWKKAKQMFAGDKPKMDLMNKADYVYINESENDAQAWKKVFQPAAPAMAGQPKAAPSAAAPPGQARVGTVLSANEKTAEQKAYDVTGKEDMVAEAHPGKAMVEGELVENLNQQQDADLGVAQKSAKQILTALYKLAKRLQAEKNDKAYALVKETFLELSKSLKK